MHALPYAVVYLYRARNFVEGIMNHTKYFAPGAFASAYGATAPTLEPNLKFKNAPEVRIRVMVLHPIDEHLGRLLSILNKCHYRVEWATTIADAMALLGGSPIPLVICENRLTDGTWRDLTRQVRGLKCPPLVLVTARHADDALWIDVLDGGGFDLLTEPFELPEVAHAVSVALDWWHECRAILHTFSHRAGTC
jgi:CheY-like chemotaxis protein